MYSVTYLSLRLLLLVISAHSSAYKHDDYTGETDLPCKVLSFASGGSQVLTNSAIAVLQHGRTDTGFEIIPSFNSNCNSNLNPQPVGETCPPWMFRNESGVCVCGSNIYNSVCCETTASKTYLLDGYCMTSDDGIKFELGRCFFGGENKKSLYRPLPANSNELTKCMCGEHNRNGTLCGKCQDGFSPLVYSYEMYCMNCTDMSNNWAKYIAVAFLPLTLFYIFVVVFKFSGTSPQFRAFIFVSQGMGSPINVRNALQLGSTAKPGVSVFIKILGCFYGVWNLDFFRTVLPPVCLDITPLQAVALDYAVAFYPLLLVVATYILIQLHSRDVRLIIWLWRPFRKCFSLIKVNWDLQGSVVHAFATFFLLSYVKLLDVTFDMLMYSNVYTMNESNYTQRKVLYFDGTVDYFSAEHLPYAIIGFTVLIVFVLLPLLLLTLYPMRWFQKCLNHSRLQRRGLDIFINCFQGYYKDGADGTRDCRYFSVSLFYIQIVIFVFFAVSRSVYCYSFGAVIFIIFTFIILAVQPYKTQFKAYATTDAIMMLNLACVLIMATTVDETELKAGYLEWFSYVVIGIVSTSPILYFVSFSAWWFIVQKRFGAKFCRKIKSWLRKAHDLDHQ